MDIQGSEPTAFEGMKKILKKSKNIKIITEFWPNGLSLFNSSAEKYYHMIEGNGFTIYEINDAKKMVKKTSLAKLMQLYTLENNYHTNLMCVRE